MGEQCTNCARLEAENAALKKEIKLLHAYIAHLKKLAGQALRLLQRAYTYLTYIYDESGKVIKRPSGVKRAVYAYHKGRYEVAAAVIAYVYSSIKLLERMVDGD